MGDSAELQEGEVFAGRYEVRRELANGDRKRTYLALDTKLDREVALSVVKSEAMPLDPEGTQREARVLGRIGSHDNIVSLYDYDEECDPQYTVFEYLAGGTLVDYLRKTGPPPREDVLRLGRQVCRGLAHLHSRGLLHRDLSARNVLLDERGNAHLGDFDSAISVDEQVFELPVTTNAFAAPEELAGQPLDVRSDLYSLGGLLCMLATGSDRPDDLALLRRTRWDLSTSYAELVESLLAKNHLDRPENAEAVLEWLDDIRYMSNIDALIAAGEGSEVELKASLIHPYGSSSDGPQRSGDQKQLPEAEIKKALLLSVTKTIAAFLNSEGGTLLIGVSDKGEVLGIEADLQYLSKGDLDAWFQKLKETVTNALRKEIWASIRVSLVRRGDATVAVVRCPRRMIETWHYNNQKPEKPVFYVRAGNTTDAIEGPELVRYIRERWPR